MRSSRKSKGSEKSPVKRIKGRDTLEFSDLQRLSFCNSEILARAVEIRGERHQWVGIGFVNEGELQGDEILIVEEGKT